tara:strand:- start:285 stop:704 length:420 start_codon:yes stop_codon:yes gene_type:complete
MEDGLSWRTDPAYLNATDYERYKRTRDAMNRYYEKHGEPEDMMRETQGDRNIRATDEFREHMEANPLTPPRKRAELDATAKPKQQKAGIKGGAKRVPAKKKGKLGPPKRKPISMAERRAATRAREEKSSEAVRKRRTQK